MKRIGMNGTSVATRLLHLTGFVLPKLESTAEAGSLPHANKFIHDRPQTPLQAVVPTNASNIALAIGPPEFPGLMAVSVCSNRTGAPPAINVWVLLPDK